MISAPVHEAKFQCRAISQKCFETIDFEIVDLLEQMAFLGIPNSTRLSLAFSDEKRMYFNGKGEINQVTNDTERDPNFASEAILPLTKDYHLLENRKATFHRIGSLGQPVTFHLDPAVTPVLAPVHHIPVTKREQVKEKLDKMVAAGKFAKVERASDWCSNVSIVQCAKQDGFFKLCLSFDTSQTINNPWPQYFRCSTSHLCNAPI